MSAIDLTEMHIRNSTSQFQHSSLGVEAGNLVVRSLLYRGFLAEREEILRHKWLESEKAGRDIGFDQALLSWVICHRANWRNQRPQRSSETCG